MGRKAIAPSDRKPAQKTVKLNQMIYPFVMELKGNLKMGLVDSQMMDDLLAALKRLPANTDASIDRLPIKDDRKIKRSPLETKPDKTIGKPKMFKAETGITGNVGTVVEVLTRFLPEGISNTSDMRSALSDGYRKVNGENEHLKAEDAQGLSRYLSALSVDEIDHLIQIKKKAIRKKAKAKRLSMK